VQPAQTKRRAVGRLLRPGAQRFRPPRVALPLGIFAASRLLIFAVYPLARLLPGGSHAFGRYFEFWDGNWYVQTAIQGYPPQLARPPQGSNHAFFPLYPLLIRFFHNLTGASYQNVGLVINLIGAAAGMMVIWALVERLLGAGAATRSVILLSFFPWAFIFSFDYSEGLLLALSAICLLALVEEQWVIAGVAALLAGAERPDGFVLALPCAWAALVAIRRQRAWQAIVAPALSPVGILAFFLFLRARTGDFLANLHARSTGWATAGMGVNLSSGLRYLRAYLHNPLSNVNFTGTLLSLALYALALVLMVRWRPPAIIWLWTVPVVLLGIVFDTFASLPRFGLAAFPLMIAVARPLKGPWFTVVAAASAAMMALLFVVVGQTMFLTP